MKTNIKIIMTGFLLALVMFCGLLAVQRQVLKDFEMEKAVVTVAEIPKGTEITQENAEQYFAITKVQAEVVTENTLTEIEPLYGCYFTDGLGRGELVYKHSFTSDEKETFGVNEPEEVSVSLSSFADGVSGTIRKGDCVDVYFVDKETGTAERFNESGVYVKDAFSSSGNRISVSDTENPASVFTLVIDGKSIREFCTMIKTYDIMLTKTDG